MARTQAEYAPRMHVAPTPRPAALPGRRVSGIVWSENAPLDAPIDELDLARRAACGERDAAEHLLRIALPRVRNLVRYLVRGDSETDDIAQEALVAILRGLDGFRGEGSFRSWSDRIVARATFAYLKRSRLRESRHVVLKELAAMPEAIDPDLAGRLAARRQAVKLLDALPDEQRQVLVLHHVLGMGVAEIAEELDTPFETIRSRLRLAKGRLRAQGDQGETP